MSIEKILTKLEKKPLDSYIGLCSGNRDKASKCRQCIRVCPQAILKRGERGLSEQINLSDCTGCGLCATICPNGVFEMKEPSDIKLLRSINSVLSKKEIVFFGCSKESDDKDNRYDLTLPCLGRLNESILVGAAAMGASKIFLDGRTCSDCAYKFGSSIIKRSVKVSQKLLAAFGNQTKIVFAEEELPVEAVGMPVGVESGYDRRDFLKVFKDSTLSVAASFAEDAIDNLKEAIIPQKESDQAASLEYRVPTKRQILIHFLKKLGQPVKNNISGKNLPLVQVNISENCSVCEWCTQFCPTHALKLTSTDETKGIGFNLSLCTKCGLCKLACGDNAVSFSDQIETARLIEDESKLLVSYQPYKCKMCGQGFGSTTPKQYCRYCEHKMKMWDSLTNRKTLLPK